MSEVVLDASAVLTLLNTEPGHEVVSAALPGALINAVNLAEVVSKLADLGLTQELIKTALAVLHLRIQPCDEHIAFQAGMLRPLTKAQGLSLGDRVCLATSLSLKRPVLTSERIWQQLSIGADVRLIR